MKRASLGLGLLLLLGTHLGLGGCTNETIIKKVAAAPSEEPADAEPSENDGGLSDDGATTPAPFEPSFPKVLSRGGPVIAKPRIVPIVFKGDPLTAQITSFSNNLAGSSYWKGVATEYGVGEITAADTIEVDETAPVSITSEGVDAWLKGKLTGPSPEFGEPDPNTLYAIYYPAGTTITFEGAGSYGQSCQGYGGYHYELDTGTEKVGYAVLPRCAGIDDLTVAASHEAFEWATDPFPLTTPAFNKLDDDHWAWQVALLGELSDLCTFLDQKNLRPTEVGFEVQRHWSNKLSLGGTFPCAPSDGRPYLQLIPETPDEDLVPDTADQSVTLTTKSIRVPAGGQRTVSALMYSDQMVSTEVPIRVLSISELYGDPTGSGFTYELSAVRAKAGEVLELTITAPKSPSYDVAIGLSYTGSQSAHYWPILVTNQTPDSKSAVGPGALSGVAARTRLPHAVRAFSRRPPVLPAVPAR